MRWEGCGQESLKHELGVLIYKYVMSQVIMIINNVKIELLLPIKGSDFWNTLSIFL